MVGAEIGGTYPDHENLKDPTLIKEVLYDYEVKKKELFERVSTNDAKKAQLKELLSSTRDIRKTLKR